MIFNRAEETKVHLIKSIFMSIYKYLISCSTPNKTLNPVDMPGQKLYPEVVTVKIREHAIEDIEGAVQLVFDLNDHLSKVQL